MLSAPGFPPQAELLVADATTTLTVSGNGDVLEPHDGVMAIGEEAWGEEGMVLKVLGNRDVLGPHEGDMAERRGVA